MASKIILVLLVVIAAAAAIPAQAATGAKWPVAGGPNPWVPAWVAAAPWFPQWTTTCTTIGSTCSDCSTKLVCTKIGGMERPCTDPTKPYCNLGECSATPSAECAPVSPAPAEIVSE